MKVIIGNSAPLVTQYGSTSLPRGREKGLGSETQRKFNASAILYCVISLTILLPINSSAQSLLDSLPPTTTQPSVTYGTAFKSPHLIAAPTVETLPKGDISFRVAHRFGDMAVEGSHYHTLFGLDQARDILLALEYGLTDRTSIGIGRAKGDGPLHELWHASLRQRLLSQQPGNAGNPVSLSLYANTAYSTQKVDPFNNETTLKGAPLARRGSYIVQAQVARRFANRVSVQLSPTWLWRNYVRHDDANGLLSCGVLTRFSINRRFSLTTEYFARLAASRETAQGSTIFWRGNGGQYYAPLSLGLELETGGHVFSISLSNTAGLLENDYLAYNSSSWGEGQFRMGFAIFRVF